MGSVKLQEIRRKIAKLESEAEELRNLKDGADYRRRFREEILIQHPYRYFN